MPVAKCSPSASFWPGLLSSKRHTPPRVSISGQGLRPTGLASLGVLGSGQLLVPPPPSIETYMLPRPSKAIGRLVAVRPSTIVSGAELGTRLSTTAKRTLLGPGA